MYKKGRFVVIDGLGKSGKTSIIRMLEQKFSKETTLFTREPGGTAFGLAVRKILLEGKIVLSPLSHVLIFFAVRRAHIEETIIPALLAGVNVICDRFDSSTDAYNLWGEDAHYLRSLFNVLREYVVSKDVSPYLYVILDVAPKTAYERHQATKDATEADKFDDRPLEFFENVRRGFLEFAARHNAVVIDANRPLEVVAEDVYKAVSRAIA